MLFTQKLKNYDKIDMVVTPAMQAIQTGKQPAAEGLKALAAKLNGGLLQGTHPTTGS